ncbi:UDP-2,3-diacylglucosamine diphosphatase [bacterium]|nr:UDP-2,3-diacylglucosamine diphosphatase [bacterium]
MADATLRQTLFLSDVHLNDVNPQRQRRLVDFLEKFPDLERLYILGDLFDFWFGYKTVIFRYFFPILWQLYRLQQRGCKIIYVLGNHDFNLGPFFTETIPLRIVESGSTETIYGLNVFVIHGDGLDKGDRGYRLLRFFVRSRPVRRMFQWIHPDLGWMMARLLSRSSKKYTGWKNIDKEKAYVAFGRKKVDQGLDLCIIAHSHLPFFKQFCYTNRQAFVVNLGDWIDHCTFLLLTPGHGPQFFRYRDSDGTFESISPEKINREQSSHVD